MGCLLCQPPFEDQVEVLPPPAPILHSKPFALPLRAPSLRPNSEPLPSAPPLAIPRHLPHSLLLHRLDMLLSRCGELKVSPFFLSRTTRNFGLGYLPYKFSSISLEFPSLDVEMSS